MNPCEQAENIAKLAGSVVSMTEHLTDIKESLREQTEIIRSVADQNARIISLEKKEQLYQGHFTEIFNRVRFVEGQMKDLSHEIKEANVELEATFKKKLEARDKQVEPLKRWYIILSSKKAVAVYTALLTLILAGAVCDMLYHKETMEKLFLYLKG